MWGQGKAVGEEQGYGSVCALERSELNQPWAELCPHFLVPDARVEALSLRVTIWRRAFREVI